MDKRRQLSPNQEVILIYDANLGFIQQSAIFKEYRSIIHNKVQHDMPVFARSNNEEIMGIDCFANKSIGTSIVKRVYTTRKN